MRGTRNDALPKKGPPSRNLRKGGVNAKIWFEVLLKPDTFITMKPKKVKKPSPLQDRLTELEEQVAQRGVRIHYDRLEAAGLKLRGGLCRTKGEYHIYVDKRKSTAEKIDILLEHLASLPEEDLPEQNDAAD